MLRVKLADLRPCHRNVALVHRVIMLGGGVWLANTFSWTSRCFRDADSSATKASPPRVGTRLRPSGGKNNGDTPSVGNRVRGWAADDPNRVRKSGAVENAIAKSPLPLLKEEPVLARPNTARAASRFRSRASIGASVATTIMHEPSP